MKKINNIFDCLENAEGSEMERITNKTPQLDDKQLERKKEQEEELKRLREELEQRRKERVTRRIPLLQRPSSQNPKEKKDDAGKAGNDGSANQGKTGK